MEYDYVVYEWAVDIMLSVIAGRWDLILFVLFGLNRTCGITAGDTVHFKKSRHDERSPILSSPSSSGL